jgi:hypothetical protein
LPRYQELLENVDEIARGIEGMGNLIFLIKITQWLDIAQTNPTLWFLQDPQKEERSVCYYCKHGFDHTVPDDRPLVPLGFYGFVQSKLPKEAVLHAKCLYNKLGAAPSVVQLCKTTMNRVVVHSLQDFCDIAAVDFLYSQLRENVLRWNKTAGNMYEDTLVVSSARDYKQLKTNKTNVLNSK